MIYESKNYILRKIQELTLKARKRNKTPQHPKLLKASQQFSNTETAKILHIEGCKEIYSYSADSDEYLNDFKQYCSKAIKDVVSVIISAQKTDTGKWNPKLTHLRNHNEEKNGKLPNSLYVLKKSLPAASGGSDTFDDGKRETLKGWCDETKESLFISHEEMLLKQFKLYCA